MAASGITVTLDDVLSNQTLSQEFRKWAREAFCFENLAFYDAVSQLKQERDPSRRRQRILQIRDQFIVEDATDMINIDVKSRNTTLQTIAASPEHQLDATVFDIALSDIRTLMETDMLAKFLRQREILSGPLQEMPKNVSEATVVDDIKKSHTETHKNPGHSSFDDNSSVDIDLFGDGTDGDKDAPIPFTWPNYKRELWRIIKLAAPISGAFLATMTIGFVNILLLGRLGKIELAAAALSNMYCNVTGLSIGIGLLSAMETLCSQAFGAGNYKRVGLVAQRATAILFVLCVPIFFVWMFAEHILLLLHQDPEIAHLCGVYARWLFPALAPLFVFEIAKRYVQAQGINAPTMYVSAAGAILAFPLGWIFIFGFNLGYIGAPITTGLLWTFMAIALCIYIRWKKIHEETWPQIVWADIFSKAGWIEFFALGLPGAAMTCADWWCFELYALMSGWISTLALAIQTVLMTTVSMLFMIPLGLSVAIGTLVGNRLGAGRPMQASFSSKVSMSFSLAIQLFAALSIFSARGVWAKIFNDEQEVIDGVAYYMPITCLFIFSDGIQGCMGGILRGSGRQKWGAAINLCCYYLIGMPIAATLAFPGGWKTSGLWTGFAFGSWLVVGAFAFLILRSDWHALAAEARARAEADGTSSHGSVQLELSSAFNGDADESDEENLGYSRVNQSEI